MVSIRAARSLHVQRCEAVFFDNTRYQWKIACSMRTGWATNSPISDSRVYTNANGEINFHL